MKHKLLDFKLLLSLAVSAIIFAGCSNMLDLEPKGEINATNLEESNESITAESAEAMIAGCYGKTFGESGHQYWVFDRTTNGDARADNCYGGSDNPANHDIDLLTTNALNANVNRDWSDLYTFIGTINETIDKVGKCTDAALSANRKNEILAEARTLRAACYFEIVRTWGDAPLVLHPISTTNTQTIFESVMVPRVSSQTIYDSIVVDLQFALPHVRAVNNNKQFVTKGVVNTLLAKIYATMEPHDWNKASQYCDAVIAGGYTMLPDYDFLFDMQHQNSTEAIWEINYNADWSGPMGGSWVYWMYVGDGWPKFNTPSHDLIKAFQDEGDNVRLKSSVLWENYSGWIDPYWPMNNFPVIWKTRDGGGVNHMIYRLPDVLLLKAEALTELNDITGAAALVNQVRARVKLAPTTAETQSSMRLAIEKERQLELAFEGHRWFDLLRTGRAIEVMKNAKKANGQPLNYPISQSKLLWPVPQQQIDQNSRLTQNAGY